MSWTSDLLTGIAERLNAAGIATWRPDGAYTTGETGIVIEAVPQSPDRVVVLTAYDVAPSPADSHTTQGVQIRTRGLPGDPRDVTSLDDAVYEQLHGAQGVDLHGVPAALIWRNSGAPLGPDGNRRFERTSNYYVLTARGTTGLTD